MFSSFFPETRSYLTAMAMAVNSLASVDIIDGMAKKEYYGEALLLLQNATFFWGEKKCEHV